jgi:predicted metal-dependent hydrolase
MTNPAFIGCSVQYTIIRSKRKSISASVNGSGELIVRAPLHMPERKIERFVEENYKALEKMQKRKLAQIQQANEQGMLAKAEIEALRAQAKELIPQRVAYYAPLVGIYPNNISIKRMKTRWGSCSSKGNLNFNLLLMLAPPETLDSVIVHELCHLKHMDHSAQFYEEVLRVFPEYKKHNGWLKKNGAVLIARVQEDNK